MFPDELAEIRNPRNPTVLFCGAGLSIGAVPGAKSLYADQHRNVEQALRLNGAIDCRKFAGLAEERRLYLWADDVLGELERRNETLPKLRFAEALGLLDDPRWWGNAEIEFRGNTPRHRVIARFAKEGLWHSIWSFNWDCILENTLEQIGLPNGAPRFESPWQKNHYVANVHSQHLPRSNNNAALIIHKPHGCVRALEEARRVERSDQTKADALSTRFMVGSRELDDRSSCLKVQDEDRLFSQILGSDVSGKFNLAVGWSMGERSLKQELISCVQTQGTTLAVADPVFSAGHQELCEAGGFEKAHIFFALKIDDCPDRDDFFLWQQTLYTLDRLEAQNQDNPVLDSQGERWRSMAIPCAKSIFFRDWADEFLPTWTRLCWSAGLVQALMMPSHRIDLERRDEHIPLGYGHVDRPDLQTAIRMLSAIPALGDGFDAKQFPGGLFHEETRTLVIPLPCWAELNELRALRPLVDALRCSLGYVGRVAVWPIRHTSGRVHEVESLRVRLANVMPVPAFANPDNIAVVENLSEVGDGGD